MPSIRRAHPSVYPRSALGESGERNGNGGDRRMSPVLPRAAIGAQVTSLNHARASCHGVCRRPVNAPDGTYAARKLQSASPEEAETRALVQILARACTESRGNARMHSCWKSDGGCWHNIVAQRCLKQKLRTHFMHEGLYIIYPDVAGVRATMRAGCRAARARSMQIKP